VNMARRNVFFLSLKGSKRFTRLYAGADRDKGLRSGFVCLKPKESVGEHDTGSKEEALIVIKGSAVVHCGRKSFKVSKGSFVYIPPATRHDIENAGRKALQYVYVTAPAV